ncbi:NAD(P)H-hydrate dehydratase [Anaerosinus massiliensis]|uniref:NAD(P)H-hydrate dehydratase n=1 Tax=Massilibacillus massiliensis TaxID=1806837 RepID=UPI000A5A41CC|nr:NAD(P)H-hydrate dehydratase [Massilibacillus massiliensis]
MKVVTAKQIRQIDHQTIEQYGMPEIALMENAGSEVAKAVVRILKTIDGKKICIFAGKGNNGGDGFVAARHLINQKAKIKVFIIGNATDIKNSAKINLNILLSMGADVLEVKGERDWDKVKIALAFSDCFIDALLGTGFEGTLRPEMIKMIDMMNGMGKTIIAVDIPSGVEADSGIVHNTAVQAAATVTFGLPKIGLLLYPGAAHAGEILTVDIGIPNVLLSDGNIKQNMINTNMVKSLLVKRHDDCHKGTCGKVLLVAGSVGMTGAAVLAANAALRSGAGLVTLAIAKSLQPIVAAKLTEVMTYPLSEERAGVIGAEAVQELIALAQGYDVIAIGPGLGRDPATLDMVYQLVTKIDKQVILDADAIHAFAGTAKDLTKAKMTPILTPHLGEFSNLIGISIDDIKSDLIDIVRQAAEDFKSILVVKSARTVVAYPDGNVYINIRGNAGMATAGSGDVLTGVISGLFVQGLLSYSAAVAGVFLHSFAGDLAARSGMVGLVANDIVQALPAARCGIDA